MKKFILTSMVCIFVSASMLAQAPKLFNYQGVARTATGSPLANQAISLKISIIKGSAIGVPEYVESHNATTNAFGLYSIAIGNGTELNGTMGAIDWSTADKFIKVEMDPAGGTGYVDLGTTQLLSVPYALYAGSAEGLFRTDSSTILYKDTTNFGKDFLVNANRINHYSYEERYKMMFLPSRGGAFRVGDILSANWDKSLIGVASFASGRNTVAYGEFSTAMGYETRAGGDYSTAMGDRTQASSHYATAMGVFSHASGTSSTAMGSSSEASGTSSTAMGYEAYAIGDYSTAMGYRVKASGESSTAMGSSTIAGGASSTAMGYDTRAIGDYSTAMGENSHALAKNSTVIGANITLDSSATGSIYLADGGRSYSNNTQTTSNHFYGRFENGYSLFTSETGNIGATMANNDNSWSSISDSTKKENYLDADGKEFLTKISQMKLGSWNYKEQDKSKFRHYGPMAQEFYAHFGNDGMGTIGNDTTIATADIDGVMMIAIQALIKENEELKQKNGAMETKLTSLLNAQKNTDALLLEIQARLNPDKDIKKENLTKIEVVKNN